MIRTPDICGKGFAGLSEIGETTTHPWRLPMLDALSHMPFTFYLQAVVMIALGVGTIVLGIRQEKASRKLFGVKSKHVTRALISAARKSKPDEFRALVKTSLIWAGCLIGFVTIILVAAFF
jgi:hypothetical protein